MSYEFYKILHVFSAIVLFTSLGTLAATIGHDSGRLRRLAQIGHGIALALLFVAGFGLMARLGMFGSIPVWAWIKIGLWLVLTLIVLPLRRQPGWVTALWISIPIIGGLAVWLAVQKPF
jgi:hypothetical protein